ncbi:MAG: DUF488 domain-containing protein, partial [Anaerolineae bacterium]|nr:DUF488 domain-containing protein [Anaerolineae bacterium]
MWLGIQFKGSYSKTHEFLNRLAASFQDAPLDTFILPMFPPTLVTADCENFTLFLSGMADQVPLPRQPIHAGWTLSEIRPVALKIYEEVKEDSIPEPTFALETETFFTLYTIGHSNISQEAFLGLLYQHHISLLVDIRSAPYSRYVPHFNKQQLERFLETNQIGYRYAGQYLGGRPTVPEVYKTHAVPSEDTNREDFLKLVDYTAVMNLEDYRRGIYRLLQLVREEAEKNGYVVIMCSESA